MAWCLSGAISKCDLWWNPVIDDLFVALRKRSQLSFIDFNDSPDVACEDVIALLKEAGL